MIRICHIINIVTLYLHYSNIRRGFIYLDFNIFIEMLDCKSCVLILSLDF